jgi:hypothetical protein
MDKGQTKKQLELSSYRAFVIVFGTLVFFKVISKIASNFSLFSLTE